MKGGGGIGEMGSSISPLVSFTLGAAMATVCVLFFMSASPGRSLVDIAAWSHNNGTAAQHHQRHLSLPNVTAAAKAAAAPAPAPAVPVRTLLS